MIHNDVHHDLLNIAHEQGWNEASQIVHLCGFLQEFFTKPHPDTHLAMHFREYLQKCADEENDSLSDISVCEHCGDPCEYHSEICLCKKCEMKSGL